MAKEIGLSLLSEGKTLKIKADGYSMYPSIKPGTILLIEPLKTGDRPVPGQIIAWKRESGLILHRLVRIFEKDNVTWYVTRGDSCPSEDNPVTHGMIAGRVRKDEDADRHEELRKKGKHERQCYLLNRVRAWLIIKMNRVVKLVSNIYF